MRLNHIFLLLALALSFVAGLFIGRKHREVVKETVVVRDTIIVRDTFYLYAEECKKLIFTGGTLYTSSLLARMNVESEASFFLHPFAGLSYSFTRKIFTPYIGAEFQLRKNISGQFIYMFDKTVGLGIIWRF